MLSAENKAKLARMKATKKPMLTATKKFKFYSDPGHGWLAVKRSDLHTLGVIPSITEYSYQKGGTVYLEEDRDAGLFVKAFERMFGRKPMIVHQRSTDTRSPIRSYNRFIMTFDEYLEDKVVKGVTEKFGK